MRKFLDTDERLVHLAFLTGMLGLIVLLFIVAPEIDAWERANDYPFGKLCEVYNTCTN